MTLPRMDTPPIKVIVVADESGGGGGGGGDASAANQTLEIAELSDLNTAVGAAGDTAATSDNGTFSLIALIKRYLERFTEFLGRFPASLGQQTSANSLPVVLPAAQITTLTPPAAITNYANESGGNLAAINTKLPAQGQALAAASLPVVLPAAQITTLTPPAAITGFATEATLAAQSAKLPATLGQKTMANSFAVTVASDQTVIPTKRSKGTPAFTRVQPAADTILLAANTSRLAAFFKNDGSVDVYIKPLSGAATTTNGFKLEVGKSFVDDLTTGEWRVIPASGTGDVRVIEVS